MKKRNVAGLIVIALFVIGIAAALMQYKREQTALEQPEAGKEPETIVLSMDESYMQNRQDDDAQGAAAVRG